MQKHESVSLADTHAFLLFNFKPDTTDKINYNAVFR
jgi:hypothetical protein